MLLKKLNLFNLKSINILVFTSLAAWAIFAYVTTTQIIKSQKSYASAINITGKQRMLSQKIALIAKRYYETGNKQLKNHLLSLYTQMKEDHKRITTQYINSSATESIYYKEPSQLNKKVLYYLNNVAKFIEEEQASSLKKIETLSFSLLPELNDAVSIFEYESDLKTKLLIERELFILIGMLITLLVEAVFIVTPAIRRATSHTNELNQLVKDRTLELEKLSITDQLTKLYNRRKIDETLAHEIERAERGNSSFSLIIIDIDHFKNINDTYGHQTGDQILQDISKILISNVRKIDTLGRWGGEEFLIINTESNPAKVMKFAEKIRRAVEAHNFNITTLTTCSIGIAHYVANDTESSIIARADSALYAAKNAGRNCVKETAI